MVKYYFSIFLLLLMFVTLFKLLFQQPYYTDWGFILINADFLTISVLKSAIISKYVKPQNHGHSASHLL